MMLNQLISRAASAYPNAAVLKFWDMDEVAPRINPKASDALAQYIARELAATFDAGAGEGEQIAAAVKVMQQSADHLADVAHALSGLSVEALAA